MIFKTNNLQDPSKVIHRSHYCNKISFTTIDNAVLSKTVYVPITNTFTQKPSSRFFPKPRSFSTDKSLNSTPFHRSFHSIPSTHCSCLFHSIIFTYKAVIDQTHNQLFESVLFAVCSYRLTASGILAPTYRRFFL